ncbi:Nitrogen permease regulator 2 [Paramarasmius palmivorus]|uniref:Nitrogen permease regulator 2 n=1 Tax=Paramarasmius palmivorus TaxID=297713 RepID=A0AAW0DPB9_9AGAR
MGTDSDSFLPRIQSVFYAGFDVVTGPKILYQVPEGLIASPQPQTPFSNPSSPNLGSQLPLPATATSPTEHRSTRSLLSPSKRSQNTLFNFEEVSKYVIPPPALCGRLVVCATKRHRIIGFPVQLEGEKYQRNFFRFNLCFVFERTADLSCYEPIVRKISRVLTNCEVHLYSSIVSVAELTEMSQEESDFLSSSQTSQSIHAILEQLYEDLNSYSETSIPIDQFNSIELKIFPFYPNPPHVHDWMVPVALINLSKRIEDNWDITMAKVHSSFESFHFGDMNIIQVCRHINGVNHISRIASLADCDIKLTRAAISHLLYYQVIMTIDIFQYSNMYTLSRSIQWLAQEAHVKEECGPYSTKPGYPVPDWPTLLHLYSRMKPGKTVFEWMESHSVHELGIDVRRFTSFGVIKGFLRRVHRWPVLLPVEIPDGEGAPDITSDRKRVQSLTGTPLQLGAPSQFTPPTSPSRHQTTLLRGRSLHLPGNAVIPSINAEQAYSPPLTPKGYTGTTSPFGLSSPSSDNSGPAAQQTRSRRSSAAERILEHLRSRDQNRGAPNPLHDSQLMGLNARTPHHTGHEVTQQPLLLHVPPNSPNFKKMTLAPPRPRISRSPSAPVVRTINGVLSKSDATAAAVLPYPPDLPGLLDGERHTDELAVRFQTGWPEIEKWLVAIGEGKGNGDYGRVCIICR